MKETPNSFFVTTKKNLAVLGQSTLTLIVGINFCIMGFLLGCSYPIWIFVISLLLVNPFQKFTARESLGQRIQDFFLTYGGVSILIALIYATCTDDLSLDVLDRFSSIETVKKEISKNPWILIHTLCSLFACFSLIELWYADLFRHQNQ